MPGSTELVWVFERIELTSMHKRIRHPFVRGVESQAKCLGWCAYRHLPGKKGIKRTATVPTQWLATVLAAGMEMCGEWGGAAPRVFPMDIWQAAEAAFGGLTLQEVIDCSKQFKTIQGNVALRGVFYRFKTGKYVAQMNNNKLGSFNTPEEAGRAWDEAVRRDPKRTVFDLNFPNAEEEAEINAAPKPKRVRL